MGDRKITIGVMIGNANSPHAINILNGIKQAAQELDINLIQFLSAPSGYFFRDYFENVKSYDYQVTTVYDYVKISQIDALIISYGEVVIFLSEQEKQDFFSKIVDIPKIVMENHSEDSKTRYQMIDNYKAMRGIVEHLVIDHGYRHFVHLRGPLDNDEAEDRARAFVDVLTENDIRITEDMIRVGDFSQSVEQEVEYLFDHNPFIEAFVCSNDQMANAVYKVCKARRAAVRSMTKEAQEWLRVSPMQYKIGVDIEKGEGLAVTGFDDWILTSVMDPPLTTVRQNAYSTGYQSVFNVIKFLNGGNPQNMIMPSQLVVRNSCGCKDIDDEQFEMMTENEKAHPELYALKVSEKIKSLIMYTNVNESIENKIYDSLYNIIYAHTIMYLGYVNERLTPQRTVDMLKNLLNGPVAEHISPSSLVRTYTDYISFLIRNTKDYSKEVLLAEMLSEGMKYLQGYIYKDAKEDLLLNRSKTWFISLISSDMANHMNDEMGMFLSALDKMSELGIAKSFLFLFDDPIIHEANEKWECPAKVRLVGYSIGRKIKTFSYEEAPTINADYSFAQCFEDYAESDIYRMTLVSIYCENKQYGVLAGETDEKDVLTLYYTAVQIGTAMKYYGVSLEQKKAQDALEKMFKEVEDKNAMLSFISEIDELTGCLNRRGFIEKAIRIKNENEGREAAIVYADLDHLKEINDTFGHINGDFALCKAVEYIKSVIGENQILARIGGDEFIAMIVCDEDNKPELMQDKIKVLSDSFNASSDKPYYVECSLGYHKFVCTGDANLQDMIDKADNNLYYAKKNRRKSSIK